MSIVIANLEANIGVRLFADRKLVFSDPNGKIYATDEITKIYSISKTIACGITGDAAWGIALAQELLKNEHKPPSELIKIIKKFRKPDFEGSTFTLVGIFDNGLPFLFGYRTTGKPQLIKNRSCTSIATSPVDFNESCLDFFSKQKLLNFSVVLCCTNTIKYASQQNSNLISEQYDSIEIML